MSGPHEPKLAAPPSAASNHLRRYLHGKGKAPYALITGATGGMGVEWAYALASHGFNVIIQGRNRSKLQEVQQTIEARKLKNIGATKRRRASSGAASTTAGVARSSSQTRKRKKSLKSEANPAQVGIANGQADSSTVTTLASSVAPVMAVPNNVEVELLVCEATTYPNETLQQGLDELLARKDVRLTVVINNLGVQSEGYPRLEDLSSEQVAEIVIANSFFPAEITRKTLPALKQNQPSLLVTVTSIGAWTPTPYLSPYMGTKGFDVAFSHSLRSEMHCEQQEVDVVCMVPGQVQSGMCAEPESLMVPTSLDWVRSAVVSLRPGGLLGAFLPYSWFAVPAGTPKTRLPASSSALWTRPKGVITPWWPHHLGMLVAQYGPGWLLDSVAVKTVKGLKRKHEDDEAEKRKRSSKAR